MPEMIKVLLVDDHAMVRQGLTGLLSREREISVVGEAADGNQALSLAASLVPDVVVMDLEMPGLNGLEATQKIKRLNPETKILILTQYDSERHLFNLLKAGASGYALKRGDSEELVEAIKAVHEGKVYLTPSMAQVLVHELIGGESGPDPSLRKDLLTGREFEILKLISEGLTNQKIAARLLISIKTVQTHRNNLMVKLNLHDRAELVKYAIAKGMISAEGSQT